MIGQSKNSCKLPVSGGGVGTWGMETQGANWRTPAFSGINLKRSQIAFAVTSIALILERLGTLLLGRPAQSLVKTPGTLD